MNSVPGSFSSTYSDSNAESHWSSNHGSSRIRDKIPQYLHPTQIPTTSHNSYNWGAESGAKATDDPLEIEEKYISSRVQEMSQEDSPQVRELALRLGNMLKVETPRYEMERKHPFAHLPIGDRWQVLQGCNDWSGLLDPIDQVLKAEIIRYGEFAQATYDAFDDKRESKTYGNSKYDRDSLLESVGLENRGYEITDFLYATTDFRFPKFFAKVSGSSHGGSSRGDANAPSRQSNWIGFVAVCTSPDEIARLGRRDIVIAWRGTTNVFEWIADVMDYMSPAGFGPEDTCSRVRVEAGFLSLYTCKNTRSQHNKTSSARDQVLEAVKTQVAKYKHESKFSITVTGHSLGSALATLCAYDIAEYQTADMNLLSDAPSAPKQWYSDVSQSEEERYEDGPVQHSRTEAVSNMLHSIRHHHRPLSDEDGKHHKIMQGVKNLCGKEENPEANKFPKDTIPITVYSFAGPRVGNRVFRDRLEQLGVAVLRVVNVHDSVPKLPGLKHISKVSEYLHSKASSMPSYKHVGVKLVVDNERSPYLQAPAGHKRPHCLEAYLHLVDAYHSSSKTVPYKKCFRDVALVNKSCDFLRREYLIPPYWWEGETKEVARDSQGNWLFPGRNDGIAPRPANPDDEFAEFWQIVDAARAKSKTGTSPHCF